MQLSEPGIESAQVIVPCSDLDQTLAFFTDTLAFELELIFPADQPTVAIISGYGVRLRLQTGLQGPAPVLRLACRRPGDWSKDGAALVAPEGIRVELVDANPPIQLPEQQQSLVISKLGSNSNWVVGRAGMRYRDLIPGRQGGRFIASHIQITDGGPVSDYAHFHRIRFQMIYCYKGWVRVVYEDQGEPFVLNAGDCVIQPPEIRHRVLESSPGLEVIEIGCPAEHETYADHKISLPTDAVRPERDFSGQRFVYHCAAKAQWTHWRLPGFEARNTGIDKASNGLASAQVVRPHGDSQLVVVRHDHEFLFLFVLAGSVCLSCEQDPDVSLNAGDSCVIPKGMRHALADCSPDLEFLEVRLPAEFPTQ